MPIKFQKFYVTNGEFKARVRYSATPLVDGRECVTLYAKDYGHELGIVFADSPHYKNETDYATDYFDKGCVRIFPDDPLYAAALARCKQ